jgi:GNAT superfamily N-acetyltransferase
MNIKEVDGVKFSDVIHALNRLSPETFPELKAKHFQRGYWWIAYDEEENDEVAAFAGMVPFDPCVGVGYLKRAYVVPSFRGNGLQWDFMRAREKRAKEIGWTQLVSECLYTNIHSANNFIKAGFRLFEPEQPWAVNSLYWTKTLH